MLTNRVFISIFFCVFSISAFCQDENLILHYSFDGNTLDQSIFQNNGQAVNAVPTEDFFGNAEFAYLFNGIDSYITAGEDESLRVLDAVSIQARIEAQGPGSVNAGGIIVNKEGEYSLARFADGSLRYAIAFSDDWGSHVNTGANIPLNERTHVALVYDRSIGTINVYLNCELVFTKEENRLIQESEFGLDELRIGGRQALPQFFDGVIDEVKVYNRAITPDEFNCFVTSTKELEIYQQVEIHPNPTMDLVKIKNLNFDVANIEITDAVGRLVRTLSHQSDYNVISLLDLPAGAYFIHLTDAKTNYKVTRKLIKQ